jgi:hypothetical protein
MKTWITVACAAGYVLGAAVTYGYAYRVNMRPHTQRYLYDHLVTEQSAIAAVFWPLYWPAHVSRLLWEDK